MHQRAPATPRTLRWPARLAGGVAGVLGLAVADLVASRVAPAGAPVSAVGELVIALLPAPVVNWGKDALGTADKPVFEALVTLGVLALCALAGQLEQHRRRAGLAVFALVAVVGLVGVTTRAGAAAHALLPVLAGLAAGYLLLRALLARLAAWQGGPVGAPASAARRRFLTWTGVAGGLAAVGAVAGQALVTAATRVSEARARLRLPAPASPAAPVPAGADLGLPGLTPYVTPDEDFYRIDTALQVPVIDPGAWSLSVTGMVEQPFNLTWAELTALPLVEHLATLTCVSNEVGGDLVGNASWLGYPVRELLARARPTGGADMVLSTSHDGFTAGTPLEVLTDPGRQALLALGMNGRPLPLEHGFPARLVVPGLYGYVSATKWVTELKVTTFAADQGYWTPRGWSARGPVKLASRIDVPKRTVDAGQVPVAGVAWAQHTGIRGVEVQVDGGPWQAAELAATVGSDTWRQWRWTWDATPGQHTLTVRATDADGRLQVADEAPPAPDGATGYHRVTVTVR